MRELGKKIEECKRVGERRGERVKASLLSEKLKHLGHWRQKCISEWKVILPFPLEAEEKIVFSRTYTQIHTHTQPLYYVDAEVVVHEPLCVRVYRTVVVALFEGRGGDLTPIKSLPDFSRRVRTQARFFYFYRLDKSVLPRTATTADNECRVWFLFLVDLYRVLNITLAPP